MHYNTQVKRWTFPAFYRSYIGQLIYRCVLLIKLWSMHKQQTLTTLPNSTTVFKHLCQLVSFTNRVVKTCLANARGVTVLATWVPKILQEWLILEFNAGHGVNALVWWNGNRDEALTADPSEFSEYQLCVIILVLQPMNSDWTTWDKSHPDWRIEDAPPHKGFKILDLNLLLIYRWVGEEFGIAFGSEASHSKQKVGDKPPTSPKVKKSCESMRVQRGKGEKEAMASEEDMVSGDGDGDGNSGVDMEEECNGQVGKVIKSG